MLISHTPERYFFTRKPVEASPSKLDAPGVLEPTEDFCTGSRTDLEPWTPLPRDPKPPRWRKLPSTLAGGALKVAGKLAGVPELLATLDKTVEENPNVVSGAYKAVTEKAVFGRRPLESLRNNDKAMAQIHKSFGPKLAGAGLELHQLLEYQQGIHEALRPGQVGRPNPTATLAAPLMQVLENQNPQALIHIENDEHGLGEWLGHIANGQKSHFDRHGELGDPENVFQNLTPPKGWTQEEVLPVLGHLSEQIKAGEKPVFVDFDGDLSTVSTTEGVAAQILGSLTGDHDSAERASLFSERNTRLNAQRFFLDPWLQENAPETFASLERSRNLISPLWQKGQSHRALGYGSSPKDVREAQLLLTSVAESDRSQFIDVVSSLNRDSVTGLQSYWGKLLKELPIQERRNLLQQTVEAWAGENSSPEKARPVPTDLPHFDRQTRTHGVKTYDRGLEMTEVLESTMAGLGHDDRAYLNSLVKSELPGLVGEKAKSAITGANLQAITDFSAKLDGLLRRPEVSFPEDYSGIVGVGEFSRIREFSVSTAEAKANPLILGDPSKPAPQQATSLVFQGGGGKGQLYPGRLRDLSEALSHEGKSLRVTEVVGTSAGALTAAMLAAGYQGEELEQTLESLNFERFNSDFFDLESANNEALGGIGRTGTFSMRAMADTLNELLSKKLGIEDRPVTFKDMPVDLKVVGVVASTDLPETHPLRSQIKPDGEFVFSRETTPDFDVVGALLASVAVPLWFNNPTMFLSEPGPEGPQEYRMDFIDGGVVNNFPVAHAGHHDERSALVSLPVYHTCEEATLDTLTFGNEDLPTLDHYNRLAYQKMLTGLGTFVDGLEGQGYDRSVLAFSLTSKEKQPDLVIQGRSRAESQMLRDLSKEAGLQPLSLRKGDKAIKSNLIRPGLVNVLANWATDSRRDRMYQKGDRRFEVPGNQLNNSNDVLQATCAAMRAAGHRLAENLFEATPVPLLPFGSGLQF